MLRADCRECTLCLSKNPNVKGIRTTIETDKDGVETVLVVETDLELNAADPAFGVGKADALIDAAMKSFGTSGGTQLIAFIWFRFTEKDALRDRLRKLASGIVSLYSMRLAIHAASAVFDFGSFSMSGADSTGAP
jgi:hypothetical protein